MLDFVACAVLILTQFHLVHVKRAFTPRFPLTSERRSARERDGFAHTAIQDRSEVDSENVAPEEVFHMKRLLLLSAVLLTSLVLAAPGQARLAIGDPAPDFSLPDVNSDYHSLSDYEGQVVLINFWASW
jgi:hypothetical protein